MFDRYVMIDWSSHNHPKIGKDSIWVCDLRTDAEPEVMKPPTRFVAEQHLRSLLAEAVSRNQRVLIGLDFPYGYPRGLASALTLASPAWWAVWEFLASRVTDSAANQSNRFQTAAEINHLELRASL